MKRRGASLSVKFIAGFVVLVMIISIISICYGFDKYKVSVEQSYNDNGYQIARIVRTIITDEEIVHYAEFVKGDIDKEACAKEAATERYLEIEEELSQLREATGANDIYVGYIDLDELHSYQGTKEGWFPLRYMFDVYEKPELKYTLGDASAINPEFIKDCEDIMTIGERPTNHFVSKSEYGYNTSALMPVLIDGEVVAIIDVEIPMATLQAEVYKHISDTVFTIVAVIVIFMAAYIFWFHRKVIAPIMQVSSEAEAFTLEIAQDSEDIGYNVSDKLLNIRTGDEIELLAKSVYNMEKNIDEATKELIRVTKESEREKAELGIANKIQKDILPTVYPAFPDRHEFDISASMTPARMVGGDFYDYFFIDESHLVMIIADVTGKGIPAALFMIIAKTMIKNRAMSGGLPSEILFDANNQLHEGNDSKMFVTVWLGILDISTGVLRSANAGHEYPVIMGQDKEYRLVKDRHGLVMGLRQNIKYTDTKTVLSPGDTVFVYTDGVPDAESAEGKPFGMQRLIDVLNSCREKTVPDTLNSVLDAVRGYSDIDSQFDDITMLCVRYMGDEAGKYKETTLQAVIENAPVAMEFLEKELKRVRCGDKLNRRIVLAMEEIFVNVVSYAYKEDAGDVNLKVSYPVPYTVQIEVTDSGVKYNPLTKPDPDTKIPLKKRGKGGMGIFLAKNIMDEMEYEYKDGCNHLTMRKRYKGAVNK